MKSLALLAAIGLILSLMAWFLGGWASLVGGALATAGQVFAVGILKPTLTAPNRVFMIRWMGGMGVRASGLALVLLTLPVLAGSLGYLGVLLPLLFTETVFLK